MDKTQAEAIKVQILERRNYLKSIDTSLKYSKQSLYMGMQERLRRREDRAFEEKVFSRDEFLKRKLNIIEGYIEKRGIYERALKAPPIIPVNGNGISIQSTPLLVAPIPPKVVLPLALKGRKASRVRRTKRGIRGRR